MNVHMTNPKSDTEREMLAARLQQDPAHFEPTTAFRLAQHLAQEGELEIVPHLGIEPTPLAVSGFRQRKGKFELKSALAALVGPLGSMPPEYNELLLREERNRSRALTSFVSLFATRFSELFVEAAEKYRLARRLRWSKRREDNTFRKALLSLAGFGTARMVETAGVDENVILRFAGFFADRTRNAASLRAMLEEFSRLPIRIEQFRPRWVSVAPEELSQMGSATPPRLGVSAMAGSKALDMSGAFRIVIGPVDYADYLTLAPGGRRLQDMFALARLFVGSGFEIDAQVILKKEDVPFCQMGNGVTPARLGWNTWARVAELSRDSADAIVTERQAMPALKPAGAAA
ncbi:type VI secretion system baseplate subunit TssG [Allorhizobium terrae]|nr:type VI secretion system baseplate subunit TssG [Allorhizobium terrae]